MIATKLDVEYTTLLDSCIQLDMFTNISDIQSHPSYLDLLGHWIRIRMIGGMDNMICALPPCLKTKFNIKNHRVGNNKGYLMNTYLQCEFYTKTSYKPSVLVFSMPTSNY